MQNKITTNCTLCKSVIIRQMLRPVMVCFSCKKERIKKNYQSVFKK